MFLVNREQARGPTNGLNTIGFTRLIGFLMPTNDPLRE
jgi:hypothetical protein